MGIYVQSVKSLIRLCAIYLESQSSPPSLAAPPLGHFPKSKPVSASAKGSFSPRIISQEISPTEQRMPTTAETIGDLRMRLARELYRLELDLLSGGRIASRPCDCLEKHSSLGVKALAEELIPMSRAPLYGTILSWVDKHTPEFKVKEVAKNEPDYYRAMAPEVRTFRKQLMETESLGTIPPEKKESQLSLDEAKKLAAEKAAKEVERVWHSQEKK